MRHSICGVVQPSTRAASSSSSGISRTNTDISQMPIGRLSATCARTSAGIGIVEPEAAEHHVPRPDHRDRREHVEDQRPAEHRDRHPARPAQAMQRVRGERRERTRPAPSTPRRRSGCCGSRRDSRTLRENRSSLKFAQHRREEHIAPQERDLRLERRERDPDHRKDHDDARRARAPRAFRAPSSATRPCVRSAILEAPPPRGSEREDDDERQHEQHDHRHRGPVAHAVLGEEPPVDREAHAPRSRCPGRRR